MKIIKSCYFLACTLLALFVVGPAPGFGGSSGKIIVNISGFPSSDGFAMMAGRDAVQAFMEDWGS